ncbi:glycosyltransferase [Phenylobacterium sp.]|uniref:glycosyltransferase n=1 Tax=Phenylobacterium sp. TaxID=1871053 RepID=UPI003BAB9C60
MKIVLGVAGTAGDLNPFVALALELKRRGHEPVIATQDDFRQIIEDEGLGFHPVRPSVSEVMAELGLDAPDIIQRASRGSTGLEFAVRRIAMRFLRRAYGDMRRATADADLVITHTSAFAARLAAETRGLPWISTALSPFTFMSAHEPPVLSGLAIARRLRDLTQGRSDAVIVKLARGLTGAWTREFQRLRRELGLPPCPNPLFDGQFSPYGTLGLFSPRFGAMQPDFPQPCALTGFCFYDHRHGVPATLSEEMAAFLRAGEAPIIFTLGSTLVMKPGHFYEVGLAAAHQLGRRAILLTGPDSGLLARPPTPNVLVADYAPHSELFPHALAIVHHGGVGTTAQALRAGKPQLIIPFSADQPDNGERVARLGVGRAVPHRRLGVQTMRGELEALLAGDYVAAAGGFAASIAGENGPAAAADVIETALAGGALRRHA